MMTDLKRIKLLFKAKKHNQQITVATRKKINGTVRRWIDRCIAEML